MPHLGLFTISYSQWYDYTWIKKKNILQTIYFCNPVEFLASFLPLSFSHFFIKYRTLEYTKCLAKRSREILSSLR